MFQPHLTRNVQVGFQNVYTAEPRVGRHAWQRASQDRHHPPIVPDHQPAKWLTTKCFATWAGTMSSPATHTVSPHIEGRRSGGSPVRAGTMAARSAPGGSKPSETKSAASSPNSRFTMCSVARISPLRSHEHAPRWTGAPCILCATGRARGRPHSHACTKAENYRFGSHGAHGAVGRDQRMSNYHAKCVLQGGR